MRKINVIFVLTALAIISTSCSSKNNIDAEEITLHNKPYPASFSKEKVVKVEALTKKSIPHFARIEDNDHIYIKFRNGDGDHEIWKYNTSCELREKFLVKYGQGPREAIKPIILGGSPDRIVMYDISYRRLLFWDATFGKCVMKKRELITHQFPYNGYGYSTKFDRALIWEMDSIPPKMDIAINVFLKSIDKNEGVPDLKIYELQFSAWDEDLNKKLHLRPSQPFHCILIKNFIFLVNVKDYVLYKYDMMGTLLKKVKVKFHYKKFSDHLLKKWERSYGVKKAELHFPGELWPACWLIPIDSGFVVGRREDYNSSEKNRISVDYFDMSLRYLGKIKMPWFGRWNDPFYCQTNADLKILGKNKYLYIIDEDEEGNGDYVLRRWRFSNHTIREQQDCGGAQEK